jgi:tRNA A37 methylthiotransferase MiaB
MKKVYIYVNGCERRALDAKRLQKYFLVNGHKIVNDPNIADINVLIFCATIDSDTKHALELIKDYQKRYSAELIVAGCLPAIDKEKLKKIYNKKKFITSDLNRFPEKIDELFPHNKIKFKDIEDSNIYDLNFKFQNINQEKNSKFFRNRWYLNINAKIKILIAKTFDRNLYKKNSLYYNFLLENPFLLRISWGCPNNCSYCGIRKAIGPLQSKPIKDVIKEYKKGLENGYKTIVLVSDDSGSYGIDINSSFPELLDELTKTPGDYKIIIRDFNARWLVKYIDELEEIFKRGKIDCIDIPIQSGSPRILKLMRRYSDIKKTKDALLRLKNFSPNMLINTHYILGFPSETLEDFKETISFLTDIKFNAIIVFPFSEKSGTKAEEITPKISKSEITKRIEILKNAMNSHGYYMMYKPGTQVVIFGKRIISFD